MDIAMLAASTAHTTITGADDWPMFLAMMKLLAFVVSCAWVTVVGLIVYIWNDLKKRISTQRAEDNTRCTDCKKSIWEHIEGPVWTAINDCLYNFTKAEQKKLCAEIKRNTELSSA